MLAHDLVEEYQRIVESGISPGLLGAFSVAVAACYSGAVTLGRQNSVDFPLDDDSMVIITVDPGKAPQFTVIEKVHADMGEVTVKGLEGKGQ